MRMDLDTQKYPLAIILTAAQMATLRLTRADFHGDWNYSILPR